MIPLIEDVRVTTELLERVVRRRATAVLAGSDEVCALPIVRVRFTREGESSVMAVIEYGAMPFTGTFTYDFGPGDTSHLSESVTPQNTVTVQQVLQVTDL